MKMTASTDKKFPWKKGIILLLLLTAVIFGYDTCKQGCFKAPNTSKCLRRTILYTYGQQSWTIVQEYSSKGLEFIEATSPEYYKATIDTCKPYMKLAGDVYLVIRNVFFKIYENVAEYSIQNGPVVLETIEYYVPGMLEKIRLWSNQGLEFVIVYSNLYAEKLIEYSVATFQWLEHNVFVGKLSPENLQNYASKAIDTTQSLASQTYDWVYEKMQTV